VITAMLVSLSAALNVFVLITVLKRGKTP
jgi:hypothetical protein